MNLTTFLTLLECHMTNLWNQASCFKMDNPYESEAVAVDTNNRGINVNYHDKFGGPSLKNDWVMPILVYTHKCHTSAGNLVLF